MLAAALRAGAFVFAAYATGRVLSRRARAGDERRIEQLRRECGTDMLTGLLNRRGGYLPVLLIAGIVTGMLIGIVAAEVLKRLKNITF